MIYYQNASLCYRFVKKNNTISLISLYASVENKTNFCTSSRIVYLNLILSLPLCIDGRNSVIPNSLSVIQDYV